MIYRDKQCENFSANLVARYDKPAAAVYSYYYKQKPGPNPYDYYKRLKLPNWREDLLDLELLRNPYNTAPAVHLQGLLVWLDVAEFVIFLTWRIIF